MKNLIFKKLGYKVHKVTEYLANSFNLKGSFMEHSYYSCILPGKELILVIIQPSDFIPSTEILYEANPGYSDGLVSNLNTTFMEFNDVILEPDIFKYPETEIDSTKETALARLCSYLTKHSFYSIQY